MEMLPQDTARFEEITRLNAEMEGLCDRIMAQNVSHRVKAARLRAVKRDAQSRLDELQALVEKYEFLDHLDVFIEKLQKRLAKF